MKDDVYITLLKQAREELKTEHGISWDEFKSRVSQLGLMQDKQKLCNQIYNNGVATNARNMHMGLDAYMMLLEYEELSQARLDSQQARKESVEATNWAKRALWISVIALLTQIILSLIELVTK